MRYLWLIPAVVAMGIAVLFVLSSAQRRTGASWRERLAYLFIGLCLQAASIATAVQVDA